MAVLVGDAGDRPDRTADERRDQRDDEQRRPAERPPLARGYPPPGGITGAPNDGPPLG